jgi:hypothetical protein
VHAGDGSTTPAGTTPVDPATGRPTDAAPGTETTPATPSSTTPPGTEPEPPITPDPPSEVDPAGVGVSVVDTKPEPEDFSFKVVSTGCSTVLEALESLNPEFVKLIEVASEVPSPETFAVFKDKAAEITVLVPPRTSAKGLLYGHEAGDVTPEEVRSVTSSRC